MNNSQFRNLVASTTGSQASNGTADSQRSAPQPFKTPALGSRMRSSIPMTPRSVAGSHPHNDFARQVAEQRRELDGQPQRKKFKSTSAPKGTKLAGGYQDRARLRDEQEEDDKEKRLRALEEMLKLQQIDQGMFERLREEIGVGGRVESTHLVKGLDWRLLERVRGGERVDEASEKDDEKQVDEETTDVDEELDSALQKEVVGVEKMPDAEDESQPPTADNSGQQILSRDEILRRLKESRSTSLQKPKEPEPLLGDRFKKVGSGSRTEKKRFTEVINGRRRDVLITTDKDGRTKRKVKWLDRPGEGPHASDNAVQQPLGMEVPAELAAKQQAAVEAQKVEDDEDDDIFAGVGADYDPLAEIPDDSDDDGLSESNDLRLRTGEEETGSAETAEPPPKPRSYFSANPATGADEGQHAHPAAPDPTILAAIKRAAAIRKSEEKGHDDDEQDVDKSNRNQAFLHKLKQREADDAGDLDLGFGESRFGDEEDEDGPLWDEDDTKGVRKRGRKKRKGDKDSVQDVLGVLAGRKK